ncbi:MAG: transposase, partial [Verrucomicrobiaceae bacterium]
MTPDAPDPTSAAPPANWQELVATWEQHRQAWQTERAHFLQTIAQQQQQIDTLLTQVKYLNKQLHGQKSERFTSVNPGELLLPGFLACALATSADFTAQPPPPASNPPPKPAGAAARKKSAGRPQFIFPPDCPVIQREILPAEVIARPDAYRKIREAETELLHITPAQFSKLIIRRPVFVPVIKDLTEPSASAPIIAPLATLQEDSHVSASTLAYIITSKYADHLPFYRQEQIYKTRHGIYLPRQTMCRWAGMAHEVWLPGILGDLKTAILRSNFLHIDETPIKYLCPGNGQTKQGYLWVIHAPGIGTYCHWSTSRGAKVLAELLPENWSGHIMCDGYAVYDKLRKDRPKNITLCACLA